ncbi:MAG: DUF357 domain-containing protein [Candidatus Parvarchaeota archaeon]|nr:DUF357 domain-containing protein [Candidatus Parvarchaeota archaeon]MCW1301823.1 DUF357 domain-containing protein [Candidatus Parvarchaeota archaeon]
MEKQLVDRVEKNKRILDEVFGKLEMINPSKGADELLDGAKRYYEDGRYFLSKGDYVSSLEAFVISWAYVDAGLKLGLFRIPKEFSVYFT